jgi:hypothetical protein
VLLASVMSGAEEKVPTGGELTLFEAVGPVTAVVAERTGSRG